MANENLTKAGRPYKREQHRMSRTPIFGVYTAMLSRCQNPNSRAYPRYGGRGITVCERWQNSFLAFYEDMGDCPKGGWIDRIDNNRGYEPGNCRWTTPTINNRNRSDNVWLEFRGERLTLAEWSDRTGLGRAIIAWRLKHGMTTEQALTTPLEDLNLYVNFHGERMTFAEVARRVGLDRETIRMRMKRHDLSLEEAATMPLQRKRKVQL